MKDNDDVIETKDATFGEAVCGTLSVVCPACGGRNLERYGRTKAGRQKYRCLDHGCRRQFVAGSNHLIDPEVKSMVEKLLSEDVAPKKVLKIVTGIIAEKVSTPAGSVRGISLRWIYEIRRRLKLNV